MTTLIFLRRVAPLVATLLIAAPFPALAEEKKGVSEAELKYQAGASPLATEPMYQSANPKAPPMTKAEFDSPQGVAVLQMWQDMAKSGIMPVANDQQWGAAFPSVTVCIGNHDRRYLRVAYEHGIPRRMLRSLSESYQTPPGWQWMDSVTIDGVLYTHGEGLKGQYAYRRAMETMGCDVVIGHIHSYPGIAHTRKLGAVLQWGMCVGCAIDEASYAMAYGRHMHPRPVLGCGIVRGGVPHYIPMGEQL
jgi:hypothetical protein